MQRMGQKISIQKILYIFQPNEKMEDVAFFSTKVENKSNSLAPWISWTAATGPAFLFSPYRLCLSVFTSSSRHV